jgi:hypothetical protein
VRPWADLHEGSSLKSGSGKFVEQGMGADAEAGTVLTTLASYQALNRNMTSSLAAAAAAPAVANETKFYLANIGKVKTIDDFINNFRLFSFAMKAYGLQDMTYGKGMIRKLLEGGLNDPRSLANTLTDPRYRALAAAFDFASHGATTSSLKPAQGDTVDRYVRQTLEDDAGNQNAGVRLALYFQRMAPGIKSAYNILADPALLKVAQTVLQIPASSSQQDIAIQAQTITNKINLKDLQDPTKLQKFLQRFTVLYDLQNPSSGSSQPSNPILAGAGLPGISVGLLTSLQGLRPAESKPCRPAFTYPCRRRWRCASEWTPSPTTSPT